MDDPSVVGGTSATEQAADQLDGPRISRKSIACLIAVVAGSLISLWLRALVPLRPLAFAAAPHDEGYFERTAVALAKQDWLGPFDGYTLIKGPAYPVFVMLTGKLGIPLQVAAQLTYLLAAGCLALCVWLATGRLVAATAVYLVLAFDPVNYTSQAARVIRDSWCAALSLLLLSALFVLVWCLVRRVRLRWTLPAAALTGITGAAFWLCREEGAWMGASVLVIAAGLPIAEHFHRVRDSSLPAGDATTPLPAGDATTSIRPGLARSAARTGLVLLLVAATFIGPIAFVGWKNEQTYGANLITDFASGAFVDAYTDWSRVRGVELEPYVPINRAQRELVYAISPAAMELEPTLDGLPNAWIGFGCASVNVCDDFAGGWTSWAIRDAAAAAGHFDNEVEFQAFFTRLDAEINAACDNGELDCAVKLPPSVQPLFRAPFGATVRSAAYWFAQLPFNSLYYTFSDDQPAPPIPDGERATLRQAISGVPETDADAAAAAAQQQSRLWIYEIWGRLFVVLFGLLLVLSVVGLVLGFRWRKDRPRNRALWVLSAALIAGIVARLVLLAVVDTTLFALDPKYHYPTRTFLLAVAAIGTANLVFVVRRHRARTVRDPAAASSV